MDNVIVDTDIEYEFSISETLKPEYKISRNILEWLKNNLEQLADDKNNKIFSKVNTGYTDDTLKSFGAKPVCDIHINNYEYDSNLEEHYITAVNTVIVFFLKGATNETYIKLASLHDYILQEFMNNEDYRCLDDIVSDTLITDSTLSNQPMNKRWNCVGGFELKHILY